MPLMWPCLPKIVCGGPEYMNEFSYLTRFLLGTVTCRNKEMTLIHEAGITNNVQ